ncbi:unnamed protein product [Enterobius vermicularis]|uniref:CDK-activating kinase assembly factor MAT1 n=1 Tax=Enterobius vermicularis TaxID=51028 RepID=A0A0N4VFW7_ENTVE|nr:unnamed protein product [Enterobius vermicularis]
MTYLDDESTSEACLAIEDERTSSIAPACSDAEEVEKLVKQVYQTASARAYVEFRRQEYVKGWNSAKNMPICGFVSDNIIDSRYNCLHNLYQTFVNDVRLFKAVITRFANELRKEVNKIFKIIFREEVTSAVDRNKLEARLELEIRNIKEKNKKYADYLASLSEDEKDKEEEVYEEFLNKNDNFLSMLMSAEELQVELEWKFREEFKKESLKEGNHNVQRLPDLSLPTFSVAGLDVEYDYPGFLVTKPEVEVAYIKPLPTNEYLEGNALSKDFSYDLPVEVAQSFLVKGYEKISAVLDEDWDSYGVHIDLT